MKLRAKELCPLHRRRDCCGRAEFQRYAQRKHASKGIWSPVGHGVMRAPDGREKCSPAALRRRKDELIRRDPTCIACGQQFSCYSEIELAHIESKGNGGFKRNDARNNLALMHADENREQGSRSLEDYLADPNRIGLKRLQLTKETQ